MRNEKRNPKLEATHLEKAKELYTKVRCFIFFLSLFSLLVIWKYLLLDELMGGVLGGGLWTFQYYFHRTTKFQKSDISKHSCFYRVTI